MYTLGIDIGSTTVKAVVLDDRHNIIFSDYRRHHADIQDTLAALLSGADKILPENTTVAAHITGSGGLTLAGHLGIAFVQEVVAVATALKVLAPQTDVAIELGGEDAKIIYFTDGVDQRMNGICAGGTGSFIDQMAGLLQTDAAGLNEYAKGSTAVYPIAARCGVFAKSDIQPLINEGATREDLAASIFRAVVAQTVSGLACGKPIRGHVAFLGGPLHFLSELRAAFIRTLNLDTDHAIVPENSHLFAAVGAALTDGAEPVSLQELIARLRTGVCLEQEIQRLAPLFESQKDYDGFRQRHEKAHVATGSLRNCSGDIFLGIDAGSTTTKIALVDAEGRLLWSFYDNNHGSPLATAIRALSEVKPLIRDDARIAYSCSTGYGEALLKAAFMLDEGEVETMAHYYAASFFDSDVDCIIDIGGQDMKCIRIKDRAVDSVQLNEACSSGCGSFIETFAASLGHDVRDFARMALFAEHPVDLGTRCTVFMNSNVKQAQKEGASVEDISAGLAYSVIKNALFKVIKMTSASDLGKHIVVQGGTFHNDAILRAFEKIAGGEAVRPDIAGIMGAFGAALIARERFTGGASSMLPLDECISLKYDTSMVRCAGCVNRCVLTVNTFEGGRRFISGNRCEKGLGGNASLREDIPNLYAYKLDRVFDCPPLPENEAPRGVIGIPRVLNMYEDFPFWGTFFKKLGFSVVLSPLSSRQIYEKGIESIPSESECYPAKITHGHIEWLIERGVETIFYPCIPYERNEMPDAGNHYNCPMVTSYAENIKNNVETLTDRHIRFLNPFLAFTDEKILTERLCVIMKQEFGIPAAQTRDAAHAGWNKLIAVKRDIQKKGEEAIRWIEENGRHGIVLAGRPYHIDPEINHGIPEMIIACGCAVLTEDSISHLRPVDRPVIVSDQWMYHSRLYAAAEYVKTTDSLDLIQLFSFGCGLDAVTTDQVRDILADSGKIYTVLKIDEVNNLGAARIRIRSLLAAIRIRKENMLQRTVTSSAYHRRMFTKEMRSPEWTLLCPQMSPIHFDMLESAMRACGYNMVFLKNHDRSAVDIGLKYVNNDACYPSLIVVGQIMEALLSGRYDLKHTAVFMTQTGGGCRASNYIGFIRRALRKAGYPDIPVVSVNANGMEKNPGFRITPTLLVKSMQAIIFGDIFMRVLYATRPYEKVKGSADALHEKWLTVCKEFVSKKEWDLPGFGKTVRGIVREFDALDRTDVRKPRVGIVGEILVKFSPLANNRIVELLEKEGAEAVMPDLMDFFFYSFYNNTFKAENLGTSKLTAWTCSRLNDILAFLRKDVCKALRESIHFTPPADIEHLAQMAKKFISLGNMTGEGWFLTGEMLELIEENVPNIVCTQPFGCLPNHVVGKGVIKQLRRAYPQSNIIAVDYDPGASEVNQLNRIKLMLAAARSAAENGGT